MIVVQTHTVIFLVAEGATCLIALAWGGAPERIAFAAQTAAYGASRAALLLQGSRSVHSGLVITDVAITLAFFLLSTRANRWWPMLPTATLALELLVHLATWRNVKIDAWAYQVSVGAPAYIVLMSILAGTWAHQRRLQRSGVDTAWKSSFARVAMPITTTTPRR